MVIMANMLTSENGKDKNATIQKEIEIINSIGTPDVTEVISQVSDNETISQKNAIKQAKSYIETMAFSKKELINQLEFNKYSKEDAEYAVNSLDIDYKEQAVKQAESYLESMAFSKEELLHQLKFNGYSEEDAEYAVSKVYK